MCRSRFSQHAPFEVEVGSQPYLGRSSFTEGPDSSRVSDPGTAKAAEGAEKGKRKGRFQIVEEDAADPGKRGVGRSTSVASMDSHCSTHVSLSLQLCFKVNTCIAGVVPLLHILRGCNADGHFYLPPHEGVSDHGQNQARGPHQNAFCKCDPALLCLLLLGLCLRLAERHSTLPCYICHDTCPCILHASHRS